MSKLTPGLAATVPHLVRSEDTAEEVGSGDVPVLATPRLLAWAEQATCTAIAHALAAGQTSVGTKVELDHLAASPVGERVDMHAELIGVDGVSLRFDVRASDAIDGRLVARGTVTRVVVDRERFLARATRRPA